MEYKEYEEQCKQIEAENTAYLAEFETALQAQGLSSKTIRNHLNNLEPFLNYFLTYEEPLHMDAGPNWVDDYLDDFAVRKGICTSPTSVKSTTSSIKKFYTCMLENGHIQEDSYKQMCQTIKNGIKDWQKKCERYMADLEHDVLSWY